MFILLAIVGVTLFVISFLLWRAMRSLESLGHGEDWWL